MILRKLVTNTLRNEKCFKSAKRLQHRPRLRDEGKNEFRNTYTTYPRTPPSADEQKDSNEHECLLTPNQVPAIPQAHLSLTLAAQGRGSRVIGLTVHTKCSLLLCSKHLQFPGEELDSLLDALALGHGHLRHTGRKRTKINESFTCLQNHSSSGPVCAQTPSNRTFSV